MKVLSNDTAFLLIKDLILAHSASSLIRLGDGEGLLLRYPDSASRSQVDFILDFWFGHHRVTDDEILQIRRYLIQAIEAADVVGIPNAKQKRAGENWRFVEKFLEENFNCSEKTFVDHEIHLWLQDNDLYKGLFNGLSCGLISCRSVSGDIAVAYKTKSIEQIFVPEEYKYAQDTHSVEKHYPNHFFRVCNEISSKSTPVWFVGAGVLGKYYCAKLKECGKVGIDIGSVFDSWVNLTKRSSVRNHRTGL